MPVGVLPGPRAGSLRRVSRALAPARRPSTPLCPSASSSRRSRSSAPTSWTTRARPGGLPCASPAKRLVIAAALCADPPPQLPRHRFTLCPVTITELFAFTAVCLALGFVFGYPWLIAVWIDCFLVWIVCVLQFVLQRAGFRQKAFYWHRTNTTSVLVVVFFTGVVVKIVCVMGTTSVELSPSLC